MEEEQEEIIRTKPIELFELNEDGDIICIEEDTQENDAEDDQFRSIESLSDSYFTIMDYIKSNDLPICEYMTLRQFLNIN